MANFIDIHVHPTLKPYGKSYYVDNNHGKQHNSFDLYSEACVWHKDQVSLISEAEENTAGFAIYTQADFTTLRKGQLKVVVASLYPMEKGFFKTKQDLPKEARSFIGNCITAFGKSRINAVLSDQFNYWEDVKSEYGFLQLLDNQIPSGGASRYKLISSFQEVDFSQDYIYVLLSVEGSHLFCEGNDTRDENSWKNLDQNVAHMKNPVTWPHTPVFLTFAHHFYNGLCSHAESLPSALQTFLDQSDGLEKPVDGNNYITAHGYHLIDLLYSTENGKRILIDIKHMAKATRKEFYAYHASKYSAIPVIYSHGGVRGSHPYYDKEINVDDEDIDYICKSGGLIGMEMDQRIMGYNGTTDKFLHWLKNIFHSHNKLDIQWAEPFWNSVIYIAEHCYKNKISESDPWKFVCLGTDYDGIINPLNRYRTADTLPMLREVLINYLNDYWSQSNPTIPNLTGGPADQVIDKIMYHNAFLFLTSHF
ncbi:MAG: peptidase [Chitinophagaceae bacterium]|nr:peptidase [Chitinophagaceae bacterium]